MPVKTLPRTKPSAPEHEPDAKRKLKHQPPYNVVLLNDDDHSVDYVVFMMQKLFGKKPEDGLRVAEEVHTKGRAIVLTTTLEHAEFKQQQIHEFGPDQKVSHCKGSMSAVIEVAE
jgi:ATP-dependent Clp protease adaptor protein ClpS